ncbi:pyruvate kinase [Ramlibacter henchirensis]|uniref:Pyruvate kinase n=1 Tax=Ramlibacter henchirensis TaxID=204072 RepID=A0A4Z0C2W8_9BURK|nr:pyruvate kinase [Ramlibacter henchirensis]TFZ05194.1 pyruvate kinase [Ramlibacter henchirensis]
MRRSRNAKIVATLGPASSEPEVIRRLFLAGADVFRLNFSHGLAQDHRRRFDLLRRLEQETGRPIGIMADLQGPKLRVGTFAGGPVSLQAGAAFRLDLDAAPGDIRRASLPHPEVFQALKPGDELLLDDGKLRLAVEDCGSGFAATRVLVGGVLSDRKGVNVPGALLPISALTAKDRGDLELALELGADWVALSFVQRPEDVAEARALIGERAGIVVKLEKPSALDQLEAIVALADAAMVARGDLGVELPAERVPAIQKRIVRTCRQLGKPVIVATQMLESMIAAPVPTRAEASDVATAVYDGADAVMLSAESAAGLYPAEAVSMMDRIIQQVEQDPFYRQAIDASHSGSAPGSSVADVVCCATRRAVSLLRVAAVVCYTSSGKTCLRAARERPEAPILSLTPRREVARRLALAWGVHALQIQDVRDVDEMTLRAVACARDEGFARPGQLVAVVAGMPFGRAGTTNLLRIAAVEPEPAAPVSR